jgi:very-short-patch-repair endonuclease
MSTGVFSAAELRRSGFDDSDVRKEVRFGSLIRLRAGWYAIPTADPAVMHAVRMGGALGCVSALRWHGLWIAPGYEGVHVRFSKHGKHTRRPGCQGYGAQAPVATAVDPVASALKYAAKCMSAEDWITACDSALNKARQTVSGLQDEMGPIPKKMHLLMEKCDRNSQSGTESLTRLRLRAAGFKVITQPPIPDVGRVDLRVGRLLIECDSKDHHTSLVDYQNDRRRDRAALRGGWLTMRITYDDVLYGWDGVLDDVRAITRPDRHRIRR